MGLFYLYKYRFRMNQTDVLLATLAFLSVSLILIGKFNFLSLRSIFNYINLFVCSYASYKILHFDKVKLELFLKFTIIIWNLVGLVQLIYDRSFMEFMLPSMRTTDNRGVTSLATEPTFYGIILIFLTIICSHLEFKYKNIYIGICIFGIIFIAQSSMGILFLLIMIIYYLCTHISVKYLFFSTLIMSAIFIIMQKIMEESRVMQLILLAIENPIILLSTDASVADRFYHIYFSLYGFLDWCLLPHGYNEWTDYAKKQLTLNSDTIILEWFSLSGRIMSGYGAALFELGIFSLIIPGILASAYWDIYKNNKKKFFFYMLTINTIMFSSIPIGLSIFAFYIAFLNYLANNKILLNKYNLNGK
jgi:hypothetical protein